MTQPDLVVALAAISSEAHHDVVDALNQLPLDSAEKVAAFADVAACMSGAATAHMTDSEIVAWFRQVMTARALFRLREAVTELSTGPLTNEVPS